MADRKSGAGVHLEGILRVCIVQTFHVDVVTAILANTWIPSGNDYVIDGLWGRLGVQENFGETYISGATNGLTIKQTEEKVFLYAGASNGGVHLRVYDKIADKWGDSWSWISKPGSGYTGSQSIGVLSISDDGKYLAVGQEIHQTIMQLEHPVREYRLVLSRKMAQFSGYL